MPLASALELLASLSAVASAAGLLLNLAVQLRRTSADALLAAFSAALLLWGLADLLSSDVRLAASAMTAVILLYFLFTTRQISAETLLSQGLGLAAPVVLVVNILLIWWTDSLGAAAVSVPSAAFFVLLMLYASTTLWAIMIARDALAPRLRGSGLAALLACVGLLVVPDWLRSGAPILMAAAGVWMGWVVLRTRLSAPLDELREELRTVNQDLRQATGEAATLKTQNEVLTRQVQSTGQYRSDFLDSLGHKLRTPLNSIAGYSELLQSGIYGELNEKQHDRMGKLQHNSQALLDLINNMLELNQINGGRLELNLTGVSLNQVIDQALSALEPLRADKGLKLTLERDDALPAVYADQIRICQIVTQMIDNALKFTLSGEVKVYSRKIRVENGVCPQFPLPVTGWLSDGEWALVEVSDTGIGIPAEDHARIFDTFYQVTDPRAEGFIGTGLGLAIARRLVELHEGRLWLTSQTDRGSSFFLALRAHSH